MIKKITKSSGLSDIQPPRIAEKRVTKKPKLKLGDKLTRGFRLSLKDLETLKDIVISVEELTYSRLSSCKILRALIHLGKDIEPNTILEKIREISV